MSREYLKNEVLDGSQNQRIGVVLGVATGNLAQFIKSVDIYGEIYK